jgi:hypothetical protein
VPSTGLLGLYRPRVEANPFSLILHSTGSGSDDYGMQSGHRVRETEKRERENETLEDSFLFLWASQAVVKRRGKEAAPLDSTNALSRALCERARF